MLCGLRDFGFIRPCRDNEQGRDHSDSDGGRGRVHSRFQCKKKIQSVVATVPPGTNRHAGNACTGCFGTAGWKRAGFKQLSEEFGGVMELVGHFSAFYLGLFLDCQTVSRLAQYALSVDCDFYVHELPGKDSDHSGPDAGEHI